MLIPTIAWAWTWHLLPRDESDSWYIFWPLTGILAIVVIWHVALLVLEQNRLAYFAYAVAFIPTFATVSIFATMFAAGFPF
jgi:hypothetical protein